VANTHGDLTLRLFIAERERETDSHYTFASGAALMISTVIPERGLAFELVSTYVGAAGVPTHSIQLVRGPVGHESQIESVEHDPDRLDPALDPRGCAYDHAHRLIEKLSALGYDARLEIDERTFTALERIE
jgi:hypothetical protein